MYRRAATPKDRRIGSVRNSTIGHSHSVGSKFLLRAGCFSSTIDRANSGWSGLFLFFPYCGGYSGMLSGARSKPSITSWRAGNGSCTCNSIPIGRLGLIRKGARRGSENRRQPMEVLPLIRRAASRLRDSNNDCGHPLGTTVVSHLIKKRGRLIKD